MSRRDNANAGAWLRWLLISETLILLLALAGPGYRHAVSDRTDHGLIAGWLMRDPGYLDAVVVNSIVIHILIVCVWTAAWIATRLKRRKSDTSAGSR